MMLPLKMKKNRSGASSTTTKNKRSRKYSRRSTRKMERLQKRKSPQRSEEKDRRIPYTFFFSIFRIGNTIIAPTIAVTSCGNVSMVATRSAFSGTRRWGRKNNRKSEKSKFERQQFRAEIQNPKCFPYEKLLT